MNLIHRMPTMSVRFYHVSGCLLAVLVFVIIAVTAFGAGAPSDLYERPLHQSLTKKPAWTASVLAIPGYHNGPTLRCADCHIMHQSKQHPLDDDLASDPFGALPQSFAPEGKLLKAPDPVALCLACHDGQAGIPDVMGADVNGLDERSAGYFAPVGTSNPRGHTLEYGLVTADFELCLRCHFDGEFATASVTCIDCHNPHGNGRPRNLQWASYPGGEPQFGLLEAAAIEGPARYEASNVAYGTDNTDNLREVTNMCLDCHHVFSGESYIDPDGNGWHNRHPSYDSERGSTNNIAQGASRGTTDPAHWEAGTGAGFGGTARLRWVTSGARDFASASEVDGASNGVFCLTCHQVHGNDHAFALRWDPSLGVAGDGCDQCHRKTE